MHCLFLHYLQLLWRKEWQQSVSVSRSSGLCWQKMSLKNAAFSLPRSMIYQDCIEEQRKRLMFLSSSSVLVTSTGTKMTQSSLSYIVELCLEGLFSCACQSALCFFFLCNLSRCLFWLFIIFHLQHETNPQHLFCLTSSISFIHLVHS